MKKSSVVSMVEQIKKYGIGKCAIAIDGESGVCGLETLDVVLGESALFENDDYNALRQVIKSEGKKPSDYLDRIDVFDGYLVVSKNSVYKQDNGCSYGSKPVLSGWYADDYGKMKQAYYGRKTFKDGYRRMIVPFERIRRISF